MAIDWEAVREEVTGHLQALLRLNTVNPPGDEIQAANYLAGVLRNEGLEPVIVEGAPGRANLVVRLRGGGGGRPVMLMGHTDVVSVEPEKWTHDPFADEEAGSVWGAKWVWANHRELIDAEYALNEGGGEAVEVAGHRFYLCQVGEKGGARLRITARAEPGHASVPRDDTAISRLGRALVRLQQFQPPVILTKSVAQMLGAMADAAGPAARGPLDAFLSDPSAAALAKLPLDEQLLLQLRATVSNTAVPTILHGGHRINVIPSEVSVDVDGRVLPGQQPADWRRQVQDAVGPEVEVTLLNPGSSGIEADPASPFFDTIAAVMAERDPGARVAPYLVSGGTDARAFPEIKTYGFMPTRFGTPALALAHAHDERTSVDSLAFSTRCLYEIVRRFCA